MDVFVVGWLDVGGYTVACIGFRSRPLDLAQQIPAVKYYCLQNRSSLCYTKKTHIHSLTHAFPKMQNEIAGQAVFSIIRMLVLDITLHMTHHPFETNKLHTKCILTHIQAFGQKSTKKKIRKRKKVYQTTAMVKKNQSIINYKFAK